VREPLQFDATARFAWTSPARPICSAAQRTLIDDAAPTSGTLSASDEQPGPVIADEPCYLGQPVVDALGWSSRTAPALVRSDRRL
jgi:hypothetical protein